MNLLKTHRKPEVRAFAATAGAGLEKFRQRFTSGAARIHSPHSRDNAFGIGLDEPMRIDAAVYMNAVCKLLKATSLSLSGIQWAVDDQGIGMLPEAICRLLGLMVCQIIGAAAYFPKKAMQSPIRISLRRRGSIVLCGISSPALAEPSLCDAPGLQRVQQVVAGLRIGCMLRLIPERGLLAIMLDIEGVGSRIPAVVAAYRSVQAA